MSIDPSLALPDQVAALLASAAVCVPDGFERAAVERLHEQVVEIVREAYESHQRDWAQVLEDMREEE